LFDEEYTADCFCIFCLILSGRTDNGPSISDNLDGKIEQEAKKKTLAPKHNDLISICFN